MMLRGRDRVGKSKHLTLSPWVKVCLGGLVGEWVVGGTAAKAGSEIIVLYNVKSILTDNSI